MPAEFRPSGRSWGRFSENLTFPIYLIFGRKYLKNQNVINFRFIFPSLQSTHSTNITYKIGRSMLPKIMKNNLKCVSGKNAIFWFFEKFP